MWQWPWEKWTSNSSDFFFLRFKNLSSVNYLASEFLSFIHALILLQTRCWEIISKQGFRNSISLLPVTASPRINLPTSCRMCRGSCFDFSHTQQTPGNMLISEDERKIVKRKVGGVADVAASSSQRNPANMTLRQQSKPPSLTQSRGENESRPLAVISSFIFKSKKSGRWETKC